LSQFLSNCESKNQTLVFGGGVSGYIVFLTVRPFKPMAFDREMLPGLQIRPQKKPGSHGQPGFDFLLGWMKGLEPSTTEATTQCSTN
jgi:hypothetical protein